jgi:hypothetical protein
MPVCVCSTCCLETFTDKHGNVSPGSPVSYFTRSAHEARDREQGTAVALPMHPAIPQCNIAESTPHLTDWEHGMDEVMLRKDSD